MQTEAPDEVLVLRIDGDNATVGQRDAVGVISQIA